MGVPAVLLDDEGGRDADRCVVLTGSILGWMLRPPIPSYRYLAIAIFSLQVTYCTPVSKCGQELETVVSSSVGEAVRTEVKWTIGVKHATDGEKARQFEQEQKGRLYNRI